MLHLQRELRNEATIARSPDIIVRSWKASFARRSSVSEIFRFFRRPSGRRSWSPGTTRQQNILCDALLYRLIER